MDAALRKRQLARIHLEAQAHGLDDATYRALLERLTGKRSAALLNQAERERVITHFHPQQPQPPADSTSRLRWKINQLAQQLGYGERYLAGMCRRILKLDRLEWADKHGLIKIIAALNYAKKRKEKQE
jgi:phage gp16-like protein